MGKHYTFYSNQLRVALTRTLNLSFLSLNTVGGDQTLFIDRVRVISSRTTDEVQSGLINSDFTYPTMGDGGFSYYGGNTDPQLGWLFNGGAGIATNGSGFNVPNTPNDNAVCFLQGGDASIKQNITLPHGRYYIEFLSAQRANVQQNDMEISIDNKKILTLTPKINVGFIKYSTSVFVIDESGVTVIGKEHLAITGVDSY